MRQMSEMSVCTSKEQITALWGRLHDMLVRYNDESEMIQYLKTFWFAEHRLVGPVQFFIYPSFHCFLFLKELWAGFSRFGAPAHTNMFVESYHNVLKHADRGMLSGKKIKRFDKAIEVGK